LPALPPTRELDDSAGAPQSRPRRRRPCRYLLDGIFCVAYQRPMADPVYGTRRNGAPFINAQPRFGIYRDWRAETQTIYFDKVMFWNADPSGHPDWGVSPPPG
jgi:hypothetical protein